MKITINNTSIHLPATFNDFQLKHLKGFFQVFSTEGDINSKRLELLKKFLNLKTRFLKKWKKDAGEDFETELYFVSKSISDLYLDGATLKLELTEPPFRYLLGYEGPAEMLKTATFIEFATADKHYQDYIRTGDESHILYLIAVLYRDRDKALDPDNTYQNFKDLAKWQIHAIKHFFASCRNEIMERMPSRFTKAPQEGDAASNDFGWAGVILQLTGSTFGTEVQVKNTNIWSIIVHLHQVDEAIRRSKLKHKK